MTESTQANEIWLTQDAYDKLREELDNLRGPHRAELSARISAARDEGDLRENGGYHAAKEEQGKSEARIRQLEDMLRRAHVGQTPPDDGVVEPGMKVTVRFVDYDDTETFLFGARELADFDPSVDLDVYSPKSPLGAAIDGHKKGETITYAAPNGAEVKVEIVEAVPFGR
ncbi:MAG: transcription elongation factor GreA [Actinomycetota bacterium]|nr:transcription elongation factor GreA [Actinomycetota bacterium]